MFQISLTWPRRLLVAVLAGVGLFWFLAPSGGYPAAQPDRVPANRDSVFLRPALAQQAMVRLNEAALHALQGRYAQAEELCRQAVEQAPFFSACHYKLASALAVQGKLEPALDSLEQAVEVGFRDLKQMTSDPFLERLRNEPRFEQLVVRLREAGGRFQVTVTEGVVERGVALVTEQNAVWDERVNLVRTFFTFPPPPETPAPVVEGHANVGVRLRAWFAEGSAAGHAGDLYDNHDHDHSNLQYEQFPQLSRIEYDMGLAKSATFGAQLLMLHNAVVFGNASTALTGGPFWRSNPRMAYVDPVHSRTLYLQYLSSHLYCYPEHRDHDPGHNGEGGGYGDVFPANTPYVIITQGSSGSDRVFLDALACTLAAFRPEVKRHLAEQGLLMPTVQMIFRRCNRMVVAEDDYLTGAAHPTAFDGESLNVVKMVEMAHDITLLTLPPLAMLRVVEEDPPLVGRDFFHAANSEEIFTTPCAIARIHRSTSAVRRMVVSAEDSRDANKRPLTYHWVVLRGDPARIQMTPQDERSAVMELKIGYHPRRPVAEGAKLESNRVDIGVFVHNGTYYSPPSFVTSFTLDNEERTYDAANRIASVTYRGETETGNYVDPYLDAPKSWRDDYRYDAEGRLVGWTRTRGTQQEEFTADGALVVERDALGRPLVARTVQYVAQARGPGQPPTLAQQPGDTLLHYRYANDQDLRGEIVSRSPAGP